METLLQQVVNGLVVGSVYALIALGYTMVYGILGLINFAHGDVLMVGALVALEAIELIQARWPDLGAIPTLLAGLGVATATCMALGYTIERTAYRRLRNAPRLAPLITAIGMSFLLQTVAMIVWGRNYHTFPQLVSTTPLEPVSGVFITPVQIVILATSALLMVALVLLVNKTRLGRAMRATAENHRVASLMGVDTNKIIASTFIIGSGLAAVAGVMFSSNYGIAHYAMGFMPGLKAFTAAVLGGIGNLGGAMLGGIVLGLVESIGAGYIEDMSFGFLNSSYQDIFAFAILGIVLIFRPTGLLGERVADRA
ncbi:MAG TPA: branched-chain amino acid ABC transporter permease [Rhodocyclaceae bacterium]|uniref:branched-chain amino acid ABC transporter permease n=3 Tax=Zoogloea sp. TaxID=49181 RepID=UPI002CCFD88A|nr:branched-chain amino acid ABC transporter permease [Zoogloea sp.]HMV17357.1 branched-chain amino acid ABC transporter permease [Rhodocyclaceae bacterium]HMV64969.1 branched-chain amino acid ABC transporter permease [Rhodocyclaceae bacterium]HMW51865.1 branched-chain amino acid ABC transporter permease [Rhodocyclaceae bacterium]HMY49424.1 branched-chain amino acid ABC transporter permease [Rhodocyclaceae bacterium]HMZ76909.1 branched-chain amino acid ABC transporter permease [Rhodocyclaceae 